MASVKEKIAYALGDAAAGGIVWKVMSIAFPLFFTNVFGLTFADAAASKNGSQYLDSLGGAAGVSASGSYTCNTFLLEAEERREESL